MVPASQRHPGACSPAVGITDSVHVVRGDMSAATVPARDPPALCQRPQLRLGSAAHAGAQVQALPALHTASLGIQTKCKLSMWAKLQSATSVRQPM